MKKTKTYDARSTFTEYCSLINEMHSAFGDENNVNSIFNEIYNIMWHDVVFRTINKARVNQLKRHKTEVKLNGPLFGLIDLGFINIQCMAIRRLTDRHYSEKDKKVCSLRSILKDIEDNVQLFTRVNYVMYGGYEYEMPEGVDWAKYAIWKSRQANFDRLSGVYPSDRKQSDLIQSGIFKGLYSTLDDCNRLRKYADKFIAHSSHPSNHYDFLDNKNAIKFNDLDACYKSLIYVANFIGTYLIHDGPMGMFPISQFDQLEHLDKSIISPHALHAYYHYWNKRAQELEGYHKDNYWPQ